MSLTSDHLERFLKRLMLLDASLAEQTATCVDPTEIAPYPTLPTLIVPVSDPLTDLPSRRGIVGLAEREYRLALATATPLALLVFDVDDMKKINERYLLTGGDAVLRQLGTLLAEVVAPGEFAGRFGGDRFLIVASNTTTTRAADLSKKIGHAIRTAPFTYKDQKIGITVTIGIAVSTDNQTYEALDEVFGEGGVSDELQPMIVAATKKMDQQKKVRYSQSRSVELNVPAQYPLMSIEKATTKRTYLRLRCNGGASLGKCWEATSYLQIGKLASLEMRLDDSSVSRRHAEIRWSGTAWQLRDLGSTNGTFLNGIKLSTGDLEIKLHDIVRFGNVTCVVEAVATNDGYISPDVMGGHSGPGPCKRLWNVVIPGNRPLATPAIANNRVFLGGGFGSHEFYAFAADTGEQLWRYTTTDDGPTAAITLDDLVAFNTESCELEVLTVEGKSVWKKWLGDPLLTMPAASNGRIFIVFPDSHGDRQHYLGCFDLRTGDLIWRQCCGCDAITAPVLNEGSV